MLGSIHCNLHWHICIAIYKCTSNYYQSSRYDQVLSGQSGTSCQRKSSNRCCCVTLYLLTVDTAWAIEHYFSLNHWMVCTLKSFDATVWQPQRILFLPLHLSRSNIFNNIAISAQNTMFAETHRNEKQRQIFCLLCYTRPISASCWTFREHHNFTNPPLCLSRQVFSPDYAPPSSSNTSTNPTKIL